MKKEIHPNYFSNAVITCACGATYNIGSTNESSSVEICSACHPFFTGEQKLMDTARRVEKFKERASKRDTVAKGKLGKRVKRENRAVARAKKGPKFEIETTKSARIKKEK